MSKPLHILVCFLALVFINRFECIKLTKENVLSLGGVNNDFDAKEISEIEPIALEVVQSTTLKLHYNNLTYLQENLFQYNSNFVALRFDSNKISEIHPLAFQKLQNLTRIELDSNELTDIPENLFERNTKLRNIYLFKNRITFFRPKTFENLKSLETLSVSFNPLTSFDFNLLPPSKELQSLYLDNNNLTEVHYHDLKLRFPNLASVSFTRNQFNCSFAKQFKDYLDKEHISYYSISCISDEEYAVIVRDRQINTPMSSEGPNNQLNLEEQCYNITMEFKNDNAKVKNESEKLKIIIDDMGNVIQSLKVQLLEKQSDIEKAQIDNEDKNNVIRGLKLQLLEQQSLREDRKSDNEKVKTDIEDIKNVIKGLKLQLQVVTEKEKTDNEKVEIDFEDVKNDIKGLKSQLLEHHAVTDGLKSCCQSTFQQ